MKTLIKTPNQNHNIFLDKNCFALIREHEMNLEQDLFPIIRNQLT